MRVKIRTALCTDVIEVARFSRCTSLITVDCVDNNQRVQIEVPSELVAAELETRLLRDGFVDLSEFLAK